MTKDDDQRDDDEATSMYEARPSKKAGTLTGLGEDAVKASAVADAEEVARKASAPPADSVGEYDDEDEATKIRDLPSSVAELKKFGGTMLGLGGEAEKAAAAAAPEPDASTADEGSRKFSGTMVGLGDPDKKEVARSESKEAAASDAGSAKTELAPAREEAAPKVTKTLVMEPSKPEAPKRATPKKASATRGDDKGKTLPLGAPTPKKTAAKEGKAGSRSTEAAAEKAAPEAARGGSGAALWVGLAAVAAVAGIWLLRGGGEENAPEPSSNSESAPAAVRDQVEPAKPPEPAPAPEPEVRPSDPAPAVASAAPAEPSAAEPREEAKVEKQPEVAPEPVAALVPPPPKPAKKPPPPDHVVVEKAAGTQHESLAPALAARIAIAKSIPVARCRQKPDPSGTADAVVTFASSGQVTAVRVMDQYATTHTGACLRERLKLVTMDAFDGESVTVRVPIQLY